MAKLGIRKTVHLRAKVSEVIRDFRLANGHTQNQLADALGIDRCHIGILEIRPAEKGEIVSPMIYTAFKDMGLDLKEKVPGLIISSRAPYTKRVTPDLSLKFPNATSMDPFEQIKQARSLATSATNAIDKRLLEIAKEIESLGGNGVYTKGVTSKR